jgi:RimJ/RimL family protein N-acetyltransferase
METERLHIRNIKENDKRFLIKHFTKEIMCKEKSFLDSDDALTEFILWSNQSAEMINHNCWIILEKDNHNPIGTVGFNLINRAQKFGEIGYELGKKYWSKGYTLEIIEKILLFGFKKIMLTKMSLYIPKACHSIYNTLIQFGFIEEEFVFDELVDNQKFSNRHLMTIDYESYTNYLKNSDNIKAHTFKSATIVFPSPNLITTRDYYVDFLGFTAMSDLTGEYPYVLLHKDDIEITLFKSNLWDVIPNRVLHKNDMLYDAYFIVSDVDFLYAQLKKLKVKIVTNLHSTNFSNKEFVIEDGDGRWIGFGMSI